MAWVCSHGEVSTRYKMRGQFRIGVHAMKLLRVVNKAGCMGLSARTAAHAEIVISFAQQHPVAVNAPLL